MIQLAIIGGFVLGWILTSGYYNKKVQILEKEIAQLQFDKNMLKSDLEFQKQYQQKGEQEKPKNKRRK